MAEPQPIAVDDALAELVHQFADPYAFVRELVQNSIDADSAEIEVDVEFEPSAADPDQGAIVMRVDDFGCGMTREIIEKKLTRLFSSSKDGDRTKIGKFGIGFVSVFALEPELVCIDTSREGESWRVMFGRDRTYRLLALPQPVDGTKIKIVKAGSLASFEEVAARVEQSLRYWCEHVRADVRFRKQSICEPFDLPGAPCRVEVRDGETRVVVGHPRDHAPAFGFYNEGLTLLRGSDRFFDAIEFKAWSPRLEHTLTRDAVIEDEGFAYVMAMVRRVVDDELAAHVFAELEQERARTGVAADPSRLEYLCQAAAWHARRPRGARGQVRDRVVFHSPAGVPCRVRDLTARAEGDVVLFARAQAPVTDALEARGHRVLHGIAQGGALALARALAPEDVTIAAVGERFCLPVEPDPPPGEQWTQLAAAAMDLLRHAGSKVARIHAAHFAYPESPIADRLAICQVDACELDELGEIEALAEGIWGRRRTLVVNVDHPTVRELVALAHDEPAFAAYLLAKALLLGRTLAPELDAKLAARALGHT